MDLAELRINRTPVTPNSKCEGCVHYDGNAQSKGGACEVGQQPAMCGTGADPKYAYAPLANLSADEVDDLATPAINGSPGAMNEFGKLEQTIKMQRVCLGDEDLSIAKRIEGTLIKSMQNSIAYAQGIVSASCGAHEMLADEEAPLAYRVAKSLRDLYLSPRKQYKYDLGDVLDFLKSKGMHVDDESFELAKAEPSYAPASKKQAMGRVQRTPGGPKPKVTKLTVEKTPFTPRPGSGELVKGPFEDENTVDVPVRGQLTGEKIRGMTRPVKTPDFLTPPRTASQAPRTQGGFDSQSKAPVTKQYADTRPADPRTVGPAPKQQSVAPPKPPTPPTMVAQKSAPNVQLIATHDTKKSESDLPFVNRPQS